MNKTIAHRKATISTDPRTAVEITIARWVVIDGSVKPVG